MRHLIGYQPNTSNLDPNNPPQGGSGVSATIPTNAGGIDVIRHELKALRYDVRFDGMQHFPNRKSLPTFTHKEYGTFVLNENETLAQAIERKRKQYADAKRNK